MGEVFAGFRDDPGLRVAVVTGAGERFFSAGWDLKGAAAGEPPDTDYGAGELGGLRELPDLNKPVIAMVNGMAAGGGLELAISSDLVLAAEHARFALPEINVGGSPTPQASSCHERPTPLEAPGPNVPGTSGLCPAPRKLAHWLANNRGHEPMKVLLSYSRADAPLAARASGALRRDGLEVRDPGFDLLPGGNRAAPGPGRTG